jgi:hypothetical protein
MSNKADKCTREMMGYSALCSIQPKSKIAQCLKEASQYHAACIAGASAGVSSGDGNSSLNTSLGASPYKKNDGNVYINSGGEIPYNGRLWNGKCYAYYINGVRTYFTDSNDNVCCELGHLGNQDTSNGH